MTRQKQHYLPKFLIKSFSDPDSGYVLHWDNKKIGMKHPNDIFYEENMYGEYNSFIETEFSKQESRAAQIIDLINKQSDRIILSRKDKQYLSFFFSFLPIRNKSMLKEQYRSNVEKFNSDIEKQIRSNDFNKYFPLDLKNGYHLLLSYSTIIIESELEFPLFVENVGMNENHWGGLLSVGGKGCIDCLLKFPDTFFFPISKNRMFVFVNKKWNLNQIAAYTGSETPTNEEDLSNFLISVRKNIISKYCERSIFIYMNYENILENFSMINPQREDFLKAGLPDYEFSNLKDFYSYCPLKVDDKLYKYILLENIIWYSKKEQCYEAVLPVNKEFFRLIKELRDDVRNNISYNNISDKHNLNGEISNEYWYEYALYKMANKSVEKYVVDFIESVENFYKEK